MNNGETNPLFRPLAGILKTLGMRVHLAVHLDRDVYDALRTGQPLMKDLNCIAPLMAFHRVHLERRMVVAQRHTLDAWRERIRRRGINMISVSDDGLVSNPHGIADEVCRHIYRVGPEELLEYIHGQMRLPAIAAFTGIEPPELSRIVGKYFGKTMAELRADTP